MAGSIARNVTENSRSVKNYFFALGSALRELKVKGGKGLSDNGYAHALLVQQYLAAKDLTLLRASI